MMLHLTLKGDVPQLKADEARKFEGRYEFIDSRSREEYNVSHIENAKFVDYNTFSIADVKEIPKNTPIIVYCSIGKRSEDVGRTLLANGYIKVYNMYGGIFEWVNRGYPVYNLSGNKTNNIHPYDKFWGTMLRRGNKVY